MLFLRMYFFSFYLISDALLIEKPSSMWVLDDFPARGSKFLHTFAGYNFILRANPPEGRGKKS